MPSKRKATLTSEQQEALLLVAQGLQSKEIAIKLGISPSAVDQRIDRARVLLGASSRREAARLYMATYEPIPRDPIPVVAPPAFGSLPDTSSEGASGTRLQDSVTDRFDPDLWLSPPNHVPPNGNAKGGRRNALSEWQRLGIIGLLTLGCILAILAAFATMESVQRTLIGFSS